MTSPGVPGSEDDDATPNRAARARGADTRRRSPRAAQHSRLFPPEQLGMLEGPDRDAWQRPDQIMDKLLIAEGSVVADLGAGGGWFTMRLANRVGPNGIVYAEDVQPQMIDAITPAHGASRAQERQDRARHVVGSPPARTSRRGSVRRLLSRGRASGRHARQRRQGAEAERPHRHRRIQEGRPGSRTADGRARRPRASDSRRRGRWPEAACRARISPATCTCSCSRADDAGPAVLRGLSASCRRRTAAADAGHERAGRRSDGLHAARAVEARAAGVDAAERRAVWRRHGQGARRGVRRSKWCTRRR